LLDALDALFGADMVHCMMGDGKPDQIEAINKAIEAYEQATGIKRAEKIEVDDE
jgi:cytochrome c peroxidase